MCQNVSARKAQAVAWMVQQRPRPQLSAEREAGKRFDSGRTIHAKEQRAAIHDRALRFAGQFSRLAVLVKQYLRVVIADLPYKASGRQQQCK